MKCPYCAEEIQDEAAKCKHCGEWLGEAPAELLHRPSEDDARVFGLTQKQFRDALMFAIVLMFVIAIALDPDDQLLHAIENFFRAPIGFK